MAYVSPDMYVGIENKCNNYIEEVYRFMNEKRGVVYQDLLNEKMLEGGKMIGELGTYIRGLQENSQEFIKYEKIMLSLEETVLRFKEYCENVEINL